MKIAIIGAGISGLVVARELTKLAKITVFEKARGVGGRMATRSIDNYQFDHGSQHFFVKTTAFKNFLQPLEEQKIISRWDADFCEIDSNKIVHRTKWSKENPHFVGTPKMNNLCKYLATDIDVKSQVQVKNIVKKNNQWQLFDLENQSLGEFDWVISTAPAKQTADLIPECFCHLQQVKNIKMTGCFSLMLAFEKPLEISWQAALVRNSKISWISLDSSKPQRISKNCLVVHSTNSWAEENMENDLDCLKSELISELSQIIGFNANEAIHANIHRWRYANISKQKGDESLVDKVNKLATCGDWLIHGRIESAFISSMNLVDKIKPLLS